ncbi:MAG: glycosyltransferase family 4 protein [Verrucomicrobia bacterium]|nr:glycosyltransferase family 4 protein [Verrucomicrobiota bacterium]MBU1735878.1 glycosyltransferase family 4 protein [Verrucomicrobiota bacterium]
MTESSQEKTGESAKRLRICLLTGSFYPVVGGGERHAHLLCRELSRQGSEVLVLTRRRTRDLPRCEAMDGFTVIRVGPSGFPRLGKYLMLAPALWRLWRRRRQYDLIYVCGLRVLGLAGVLAQILVGKPCVLRAESRGELSGEFIWKSPEGQIKPMLRAFFSPLIAIRNRLLMRATCFLSISTPIREEFLAAGVSPAHIADIPNGFDVATFSPGAPEDRPALRQKLGLPAAILYAYSGKLNRGKGLERFLRVWERFAANHPEVHLILIGSGRGQHLSCEQALWTFVREHNLEASITFTGYVDVVQDYLHATDIFVFPSESEAQGLSVLEALACKVPVIASRIPGIMDMVTDGVNGRLVEVRDEDAWLKALADFIEKPEYFRHLAEAGYNTVQNHFSMAATSAKHLAVFWQLMPSRKEGAMQAD